LDDGDDDDDGGAALLMLLLLFFLPEKEGRNADENDALFFITNARDIMQRPGRGVGGRKRAGEKPRRRRRRRRRRKRARASFSVLWRFLQSENWEKKRITEKTRSL
jgi:hypothetical protein